MLYHQNFFFCSLYFRINKGEIEAEFARQVKKIEDAKADALKQEELKAQMEDFLTVRKPFVEKFRLCTFWC